MNQKIKIIRVVAIVMAAVIFMYMMSGCDGRPEKRTTTELEEITLGIDVAKYQGTIDWQRVADAGIEFAIVRVGYRGMENGEIHSDSNGLYNLQEASKAGIPVGAYFFSTAISKEEAVEEAKWMAEQIAPYPITYPIVYDCENFNDPESRQYHMTRKERTNVALAFLETIEEYGYEGMFYASKNDMEFENEWEISRIEDRYKIWVAQYPAEPYPQTAQSSYSGEHHMWQYATDGLIDGITQPVDLNVAYFGYDGVEEPKDKQAAREVDADAEALMNFEEVSETVTAKAETNLRSIPSQGTDSKVLRTLKNGEYVQRIAVSDSGWSKLSVAGEVYYAVSSYLTTDLTNDNQADLVVPAVADDDDIETVFHATSQLVTAKDTVNLRSIPSVERADAQIIAQLKHGDVATCVGTSDNGWSKLIYRGTTCYAVSSYLTKAGGSPSEEEIIGVDFKTVNEQVTAKDKVNLRTLPSVENKDSQILVQLHRGDIASRIGVSDNGWSKLIYNGVTCYAVSRYLSVMSSTPVQPVSGKQETQEIETQFESINDKVTAKVEVNLRSLPSVEDPNCVVVAKLKNGEIVLRTGINQDVGWSRVVYDGQTLYCVSSYLKVAE